MHSLQIALIAAHRASAQEALSALPDAPVVADVDADPVAAQRTRKALAAGLRRLADAVAPPARVSHSSAH